MKKMISTIMTFLLVPMLVFSTQVFAAEDNYQNNVVIDPGNGDDKVDDSLILEELEQYRAAGLATKVYEDDLKTVYEVIVEPVNIPGKSEDSKDEKLVSSTLTFFIPKNNSSEYVDDVQDMGSTIKKVDAISRATAGQQLRNWRLVGNQFYTPGDGTPYQIEGPANFQLNATTRSHWSINGNFSAMIQSIIEVHIGGYSGKENTLSWTLNVNIPQGYYRKIQVWEYLTKYAFDIYFGHTFISSGSAYRPNGGLKVTNNLYRK